MLITFSGLDGAGKSTLIEWLSDTLRRDARDVAVYHMNDHIGLYAAVRFVRNRLLALGGVTVTPPSAVVAATPPAPRADGRGTARDRMRAVARRLRHRILWSKPLRRLLYPIDLMIFLGYRLYVEKLRRRVLIMDRYFYDTLVDVADGQRWHWLRLLERITPTPDVPVLLDITPEESYARKGEYTVEYLRRRWIAYRTVFPWIDRCVVVPSGAIEETKALLERVVSARMPRA